MTESERNVCPRWGRQLTPYIGNMRGLLAITEGNSAPPASLRLSFGKTAGQMKEEQESRS